MRKTNTRRHTRYDVEGIEGTFLFNLEVDVQNMSVAGMAVRTARALNVGRRYQFTIRKGNDVLKVAGRVAWCALDSANRGADGVQRPIYHAGVQFTNVLTDEAKGVLRFIEENVILDLDKRIFGRFRIGEQAQVKANAALDFEIRRISMSGILVEIDGEAGRVAQKDEVFPLEISFPQGPFSADGRVAYVNRVAGTAGRNGKVQLGVEFLKLRPPVRSVLERFIASVVESARGDGDAAR